MNFTKNVLINAVILMSETDLNGKQTFYCNSHLRRSHSQLDFATGKLYVVSKAFYHWLHIEIKEQI